MSRLGDMNMMRFGVYIDYESTWYHSLNGSRYNRHYAVVREDPYIHHGGRKTRKQPDSVIATPSNAGKLMADMPEMQRTPEIAWPIRPTEQSTHNYKHETQPF